MTLQQKNIPALRFPEFQEEWGKSTVKDVAEINPTNKTLPNTFIYIDLESVTDGTLIKENAINKKEAPSRAQRLLEKGDILYQMVRPYQMNNLLFHKDGVYVASTGYAQLRANINTRCLYHILHTQTFVKRVILKCTGTSYPAINSSDLGTIRLAYPTDTNEQQKIADFLSAVDERIQQLTQKKELLEQYKKGVMQQIFSQQIRFKPAPQSAGDEDGNDYPVWEELQLNKILTVSKKRNKEMRFNKDNVLSVSGEFGIVNQICMSSKESELLVR